MFHLDIIVMFFIFGFFSGLVKSELKLPPAIYDFLTIVLLLAIGIKGGKELSTLPFFSLLPQVLAVISFGFFIPMIYFPILKHLGHFDRANAASIAAHYGSVSVGTFAVAIAFLSSLDVSYEKYITLFLVILEIPAIVSGVILAKGITKDTNLSEMLSEILRGKGVFLLLGGVAIGWIAGPEGVKSVNILFNDLFKSVLALFLLEMGLLASSQVKALQKHAFFLIIFGILAPLFSASLGLILGKMIGLSLGGTVLLATLAGSASYIAAPAAMRIAVPESNPSLSLTASLGITFPFNVIVGISTYYYLAQFLY